MDPWMWRLMSLKIRADEWFDVVDLNGDGCISYEELRLHLAAQKFDESKISLVFGLLDLNGDGDISKSELRECFVKYDNPILKEALGLGASEADAVFDAIDTNRDGAITRLEHTKLLKITHTNKDKSQVAKVFKMFDADGNGTISREEIREAYAADTEFRRIFGLR
jgi:Ca2+-binding EF-hand superfamily protein